MDPANHVHVVLSRQDGSTVAEYEAAVVRRQHDDEKVLRWQVLVAGSFLFRFEFLVEDTEKVRPSTVDWTAFDSTNRLLLASSLLMLQMHESETMTFRVGGEPFVAFTPMNLDQEELRQVQVLTETVGDIVAIETLSGREYEPCKQEYNDLHRVLLRQTRLLLEGHVIGLARTLPPVIMPQGDPPDCIVIAPFVIDVGGARVTRPEIYVRHPTMNIRALGPAPEAGPQARTFDIAPPDGKRFHAWCPGIRQVASDADLAQTTAWRLTGIDEETFLR